MTKKPEGGRSPKDTTGKPNKPGVKSDTFTQVPGDDKVKGGVDLGRRDIAGRKPTLDPTESSGCCG